MRLLLSEKQKDRAATLFIRGGGILVILVVVAIVLNIGLEALPLFWGVSAGPLERMAVAGDVLVVGNDPRREIPWTLGRGGEISFPAGDGHEPIRVASEPLAAADHEIHGLVSAIGQNGELVVGRLRFRDLWQDGERSTTVSWRRAADPLSLGEGLGWAGVTANSDDDGNLVAVAWDGVGAPTVAAWDNDGEEWQLTVATGLPAGIVGAAVADGLQNLALVQSGGQLRVFRLPGLDEVLVEGVGAEIGAARFLIGGGSLVTAGHDGGVRVMLQVPRVELRNAGTEAVRVAGRVIEAGQVEVIVDDEVGRKLAARTAVEIFPAAPVWRVVRELPPLPASPTWIAPAHRRRGFLVGAEDGTVALYYSTSGRRLLSARWGDRPIATVAMDPKGDGAVALSGGELLLRSIDNPHPEVSARTLFLPVWYEGYAKPKWVWQTTGGSDAFEPKMSLWPLVFGTLKATLYAMILSVPLALMAAVYVSQLAPPWLQATVKPTVELMAAVPSVVVGFLAALWLAPRLEQALLAALIGMAVLPFAVVLALLVWRLVPERVRRRMPEGGELALVLGSGAAVIGLVALLSEPIELALFGGDFQRFLFTDWGIRYDQRNSIVVGLGLGFAVIPVIFTIAEDACSAVPKSLVTASRALGATKWQTAVRLVVPAASPGLFAAVMLGLGRSVGETMIVLMAAGNTPLLDLSLFNGMRTMSAAIAVEIPEAPVASTLFRVLFLTGTLLFLFTLVVATAADLVGSYLRRRYGRF